MPVTPLGFDFQRVPPPSSRHVSRRALPFLLFASTPRRRTAAPRIDAPGRSVHDGPVLPGIRQSSLSKPSSPRGFPPLGLGFMLPRSLLSWASAQRCPCGLIDRTQSAFSSRPAIAAPALQSIKEPEGRLASFESCLPPRDSCPLDLPRQAFRTPGDHRPILS